MASTGELFWQIFLKSIVDEETKQNTNLLCVSLLSTGRYADLQVEFSAAVRTSAEQKELILKLEHDLSTIQAMSAVPRPDAEGSEVTNMENIPEPIKEATAMFAGMFIDSKLTSVPHIFSRLFSY